MKWPERKICVILGGGGHAKVLIETFEAGGLGIPHAVLDSDRKRWGKKLLGVPILGDDGLLPELIKQGANCFMVGLGSTRDNGPRKRLFGLGLAHSLKALTLMHPTAICSPWASLGRGSQILPGCIINAGATLGANVIVNSGAIVEHDCQLHDHVHLAIGARLSGGVQVGSGAFIGAGATVKEGISVGKNAIVGAGSLVLKDVAPQAIVAGVPARLLKQQ
jgi:sugar O-acyltransferase (sialic acid O-acetyltransferase NeuD family)